MMNMIIQDKKTIKLGDCFGKEKSGSGFERKR
jgi:hypothetical protein